MVDRGHNIAKQRRQVDRRRSCEQNLADRDWRHYPVFADIFEIANAVSILRRGDCLYHFGCDDTTSVIVESGWIALRFDVENGEHCIIDFCLPGDIIGAFPSIGEIVPHTAACLSRVSTRTLSRDRLFAIAAASPDLSDFLWRCAVCREYRASDHIVNIAVRDARSRVAHLLFELYCRITHGRPRRAGEELPIPLRLYDIAEAVGLTPVHVSRTLGVLRETHVINVQSGRMTVLDPDRWCRLAGDLHVPLADPLATSFSTRPAH